MTSRWQFWIDRGGTFTDCIGRAPDGSLSVVKVLSSDEAPLIGIRQLRGLGDDAPIPPCDVRMGTTLATNALLERRGVPTALLITEGFESLCEIGDQTRPDLFDLDIRRPAPLASHTVGVPHRATPTGEVLVAGPMPNAALPGAIRSAAVVVLHGTRCPQLEKDIAAALRADGLHVSMSHEVDGEAGLLARADTTVVDAYLTPLLSDYVAHLRRQLPGSTIRIMQSSGALTEASGFRGRNAVLSGPAGGVVAVGHIARELGLSRVVGFDMGGTSTDVCRFHDGFDRTYTTEVAGVRLRAPMMAIHTVAAGGGSLIRFDGGRVTVGPESAGAVPGPLAYGHADAVEPALTDANVALGRVPGDRFPFALHQARARAGLEAIAQTVGTSWEGVAAGAIDIAVASMADAIRQITVERGHDVRDHALLVFGGAGGQHACAVARRLGVDTVISHPLGGVLSAFGMGVADEGWHAEADLGGRPLEAGALEDLEPVFLSLEERGREALKDAVSTRFVDVHYRGMDTTFTLPLSGDTSVKGLGEALDAAHSARFGYSRRDPRAMLSTARIERIRRQPVPAMRPHRAPEPAPAASRRVYLEGRWHEVPVVPRESLGEGAALTGPALLLEDTGVLVVGLGWRLSVRNGCITLSDTRTTARSVEGVERDPVRLEIFANAFMAVAEQMGVVLQRAAVSTNIRERLDFSCAVFDANAQLVANAPHIPVHLGAMGETVAAVVRARTMRPGDAFVSNDPAAGGSHLPDLTVVSPVHGPDGALRYFVASRGHHADVGGITPGSMPPFSRSLEEEGVVFRAEPLVSAGRFERDRIRAILTAGPHPARRPDENLADLEAMLAANREGARRLAALDARHSPEVVAAYMEHVLTDAADRVARRIGRIEDGVYRFEDALDDGACVAVALTVSGETMDVDFAGTASELTEQNLNAPRAVTVASLLYVLRAMVDAPIPLNAGCLRPVTLRVPPASLLDPSAGRAVAGGNVETSQRVCDVLLGALGLTAASQGTMNNVTFGDAGFGYYETLAGGAGAGHGFAGQSCVHTHMTNSRITDPEFLEARFPVRLERFSRRPGSGGAGRWPGGDGLVREYAVLRPLTFSILSERRTRAPFGLSGGEPGARGQNLHNGRPLGGCAVVDAAAGDRIRIETPGGGGFGGPR
ncbi:MAG: hydantoinase B/oxoprolinase family protein [Sandaracinaceae bacterium]